MVDSKSVEKKLILENIFLKEKIDKDIKKV